MLSYRGRGNKKRRIFTNALLKRGWRQKLVVDKTECNNKNTRVKTVRHAINGSRVVV